MTSTTAVRPKDIEVGQFVVIKIEGEGPLVETIAGRVEKNTPKSGRMRIREDGSPSSRGVVYADIADVSVADADEEAAARETADEAIVEKAVDLGIDFDPNNYDEIGLAEAVDFIEKNAKTLDLAGIHPREIGEMVREQLDRIEQASAGQKDGLAKKALRDWIMVGDDGVERLVEQARKARTTERRATASPGQPREGSTMDAALKVLRSARRPMTGAEVYAKIAEKKLAPGLKGKTPEATVTAALNVAVSRGQHGIIRPEPGKFELTKGSN